MKAAQWFERIDRYHKRIMFIAYPLIALLIALITILVIGTGGLKFGYSHSMYIPILLAGFVFGTRGSFLTGLIGGLILGPLIPVDTVTGELQNFENWFFRLCMFTLIGFLAGLASDSTRAYQRKLRWLLQHDNTTRLPNRIALLNTLNQLDHNIPLDTQSSFVLVMVCCENEIELKSAFGNSVIQHVVIQLAQRFSQIAEHVSAYQTDAAQIAVLIYIENHQINPFIDQLMECANEPVIYNEIKIHIDTRMGYYCFHQPELAQNNLNFAEAALTLAKRTSREIVAYRPEITSATEENIQLLGELKHALQNGELLLHYQPKVNISTGCVYGAEALIRWQHPTKGNIPPGKFIPRAEQSTLIDMMTDFVLMQAIEQIALWQKAGMKLCISVNVSPRNLLQKGFIEEIGALLQQYHVDGSLLEIEITESSLIEDINQCIAALNQLRTLGVLISIDDFGTGYSSLQYLHQLPISILKIDQSFVRRLTIDEGATHILDAAIKLAHNLTITAIAEGVETAEIYQQLKQLGCDKAQGYFISQPLSPENFERWYQQRSGIYQA